MSVQISFLFWASISPFLKIMDWISWFFNIIQFFLGSIQCKECICVYTNIKVTKFWWRNQRIYISSLWYIYSKKKTRESERKETTGLWVGRLNIAKVPIFQNWPIDSTESQSKFQQFIFDYQQTDSKVYMERQNTQYNQQNIEEEQSRKTDIAWLQDLL